MKNPLKATQTKLSFDIRTDVGRVRMENEDSFGFHIPRRAESLSARGTVVAIADGMGGQAGGKTASEMVLDRVISSYFQNSNEDDIPSIFTRSINRINCEVRLRGEAEAKLKGMGSTITLAVIRGREIFLAHVGDSRAYMIRDRMIKQITRDHAWVAEMVMKGEMTTEQAKKHPCAGILTKSVGQKEDLEPDIYRESLASNDIIVLCTDGLYSMVEDEEIRKIAENHSPSLACERLIELANRRGGDDNITVAVIHIRSVEGEPLNVLEIARPSPQKLALYLATLMLVAGIAFSLHYLNREEVTLQGVSVDRVLHHNGFAMRTDLALNRGGDSLYVLEDKKVKCFDASSGKQVFVIESPSISYDPVAIEISREGNLLVLDKAKGRIIALDPQGKLIGLLFLPYGPFPERDKLESAGILNNPIDLFVSEDGSIYVNDTDELKVLSPNGAYDPKNTIGISSLKAPVFFIWDGKLAYLKQGRIATVSGGKEIVLTPPPPQLLQVAAVCGEFLALSNQGIILYDSLGHWKRGLSYQFGRSVKLTESSNGAVYFLNVDGSVGRIHLLRTGWNIVANAVKYRLIHFRKKSDSDGVDR